jgi:hypothetical protein
VLLGSAGLEREDHSYFGAPVRSAPNRVALREPLDELQSEPGTLRVGVGQGPAAFVANDRAEPAVLAVELELELSRGGGAVGVVDDVGDGLVDGEFHVARRGTG